LPASNGQPDNFAAAIAEVSERLTALVHDEIELAKAEMTDKARSLTRGTVAVVAGAVFGVFAVVFLLLTLALVFNDLLVSGAGMEWLGFLIVLVVLVLMAAGAFLFAWRKLQVGAPTPTMAIGEAKKIRETVAEPSSETATLPGPAGASESATTASQAVTSESGSASRGER
jgi:Putative Actinobacterial Holin-X, holin superfamily III